MTEFACARLQLAALVFSYACVVDGVFCICEFIFVGLPALCVCGLNRAAFVIS